MYKVTDNQIYITRGDSAVLNLSIEGYTPADGDEINFSVKKNCNDRNVLISKSIDPTAMTISITPEDTDSLEFGDYWYDVELRRAGGVVDTVIVPHNFVVGAAVTW